MNDQLPWFGCANAPAVGAPPTPRGYSPHVPGAGGPAWQQHDTGLHNIHKWSARMPDVWVMKNQMQLTFMNCNQQLPVSRFAHAMAEDITQLSHITRPGQEELCVGPLHSHAKLSEHGTNVFGNSPIWHGVAYTAVLGHHVLEHHSSAVMSPVPHIRMAGLQVNQEICRPGKSCITLCTVNCQFQFGHGCRKDLSEITRTKQLSNFFRDRMHGRWPAPVKSAALVQSDVLPDGRSFTELGGAVRTHRLS